MIIDERVDPGSAPPVRVRLRLEHACLQYLAESCKARVLHVKGEALHPVLSAGRAASTDCDVLVHPDDVESYTEALSRHGWELRTTFMHGSIFGHAATYYHPRWGTADVHRYFPGLEADPHAAFDALEEAATTVVLGGRRIPVPGLDAQRLILLVHSARDATGRAPHDRRVAWDNADAASRVAVSLLAERLGATVPLLFATGRGFEARGLPAWRTWQAMNRNANPTEVWIARLLDARGSQEKAKILGAALLPNRDHLAIRLGHDPSRAEIQREAVDRVGRGARRLSSLLLRRLGLRRG